MLLRDTRETSKLQNCTFATLEADGPFWELKYTNGHLIQVRSFKYFPGPSIDQTVKLILLLIDGVIFYCPTEILPCTMNNRRHCLEFRCPVSGQIVQKFCQHTSKKFVLFNKLVEFCIKSALIRKISTMV